MLPSLFYKHPTRGFTMIELLVVIAIIGVLAAAVLSAINPIEQINKGRDTRSRSDAAELTNAVERYFAIQEEFPWNTTTADWTALDTDPDSAFSATGATVDEWMWMNILEDTAEVKENFVARVQSTFDTYYLVKELDSGTTYTCFLPTSRQFKQESMTRCNSADHGLPAVNALCGGNAPGSGATTIDDDNYICVP